MTPVCKRRNDQAIEIGQDLLHRLALLRRRRGKLSFQFARLDLREHWKAFNVFKVIANPIDQLVTKATEILLAHVPGWGSKAVCGIRGCFHDAESRSRRRKAESRRQEQSAGGRRPEAAYKPWGEILMVWSCRLLLPTASSSCFHRDRASAYSVCNMWRARRCLHDVSPA